MKKRLIKDKKNIIASKPTMVLNSFITKGGTYYSYEVRLLSGKPMYSIFSLVQYDQASLYDGTDFERSFEFFCELSIALKGINYAENFATTKNNLLKNVDKLVEESQNMRINKSPLFLGDSDFASS